MAAWPEERRVEESRGKRRGTSGRISAIWANRAAHKYPLGLQVNFPTHAHTRARRGVHNANKTCDRDATRLTPTLTRMRLRLKAEGLRANRDASCTVRVLTCAPRIAPLRSAPSRPVPSRTSIDFSSGSRVRYESRRLAGYEGTSIPKGSRAPMRRGACDLRPRSGRLRKPLLRSRLSSAARSDTL